MSDSPLCQTSGSTTARTRVHCVACSIFEQELRALVDSGALDLQLTVLDSKLHMRPDLLQEELGQAAEELRDADEDVLLVFGDCHAKMLDMENSPGIARVGGFNCCEILLGNKTYRRLRAEGAFFFLPEWTMRWREVFSHELGLTGETARHFMQDMHKKLVYVDTGQAPVPEQTLGEISEYVGLPWEVLPVSLDQLRTAIEETIERLP
jgi:hypothetical protein